jgi:hypothetical protein
MNIQTSTLAIAIDSSKAVPDFQVLDKAVCGHLTNSFSVKNGDPVAGAAWTAKATVNASLSAGETIGDVTFGFVQLQKAAKTQFFYAGRFPSHGSMILTVNAPPAMPDQLALDSHDGFVPFTVSQAQGRFQFANGVVTASTGDHPLVKAGREMSGTDKMNRKTKQTNFLFHVIDERDFWTIFTFRGKDDKLQYLAHFTWNLKYNCRFKWLNNTPKIDINSSTIKFGTMIKGAPTDSFLQSLLKNPDVPNANDVMLFAIVATLKAPQGANRNDLETRFANVPGDFMI